LNILPINKILQLKSGKKVENREDFDSPPGSLGAVGA